MAKFNQKQITEQICALIESDSYTIAEICANVGISPRCFYKWQKLNPVFAGQVLDARARYTEKVLVKCKRSLVKLIEGFYYEESRVKSEPRPDGSFGTKETIIDTKYFPPNLRAIIWVLCNLDPENWKLTVRQEYTGKGGKDLFPAKILTKADLSRLGIPAVAHQDILDIQEAVVKGEDDK